MLHSNRLLRVLQSLDDCQVERNSQGKIAVSWVHPYDRERNRALDLESVDRLIAAAYLVWRPDGSTAYLAATERGRTIVLRYRPPSYRGYPVYPNYLNWLKNADTFREHYRRTEPIRAFWHDFYTALGKEGHSRLFWPYLLNALAQYAPNREHIKLRYSTRHLKPGMSVLYHPTSQWAKITEVKLLATVIQYRLDNGHYGVQCLQGSIAVMINP